MKLKLAPPWNLLAACALITLLLVGLAVIVGTTGSPAEGTIEFVLRRDMIQFLLIVALGAVVTFVVERLKFGAQKKEEELRSHRDKRERQRQYAIDTTTSILDRLDLIYRGVKRRRHSFRLLPKAGMPKQAYVEAMWEISDDKQELEKLYRDLQVVGRWLPDVRAAIPFTKGMEDYLRPMENEWEKVASTPGETLADDSITEFDHFRAKSTELGSSFSQFRNFYHDAREVLVAAIAKGRTDSDAPESTT